MQRPNIIFIVADDLGYADLGCFGARETKSGPVSPVLDGLARNGLLFRHGYANSPVCSPTRFGMMTGRYQYRLRGAAEEPIRPDARNNATLGLPPAHPTLPSLLKNAGYHTVLIGKWHLGFPPAFGPLQSGYDAFYGSLSGGVDYFHHTDSRGTHDLWLDSQEIIEAGYLTDLLSKRAAAYVEGKSQEDKPFFLSLHYTAPHWPWETRDDAERATQIKDRLFDLSGGNIHHYQRMIHHMDEGIGWIVHALREAGILDNTLIVFTSDNGGERFSDNWPLVGGKMDLTEGGIRVPWIAHWPSSIEAGGHSDQLCMTMDWTATMLDIAGAVPDKDFPLDGVSLAGILKSPNNCFDRPLYWRMKHHNQRALRIGNWKYLRVNGHDYLFNLAQDERERANLAEPMPERLASMRQDWEAWNATMPPIPEDATVSPGYSIKDMPQR